MAPMRRRKAPTRRPVALREVAGGHKCRTFVGYELAMVTPLPQGGAAWRHKAPTRRPVALREVAGGHRCGTLVGHKLAKVTPLAQGGAAWRPCGAARPPRGAPWPCAR